LNIPEDVGVVASYAENAFGRATETAKVGIFRVPERVAQSKMRMRKCSGRGEVIN
jgi:hypothetical protein